MKTIRRGIGVAGSFLQSALGVI